MLTKLLHRKTGYRRPSGHVFWALKKLLTPIKLLRSSFLRWNVPYVLSRNVTALIGAFYQILHIFTFSRALYYTDWRIFADIIAANACVLNSQIKFKRANDLHPVRGISNPLNECWIIRPISWHPTVLWIIVPSSGSVRIGTHVRVIYVVAGSIPGKLNPCKFRSNTKGIIRWTGRLP